MPINNPWQPQANHDPKQQRKIIQRFGSYFDLRIYPLSLPNISRFGWLFQRMVSYYLLARILQVDPRLKLLRAQSGKVQYAEFHNVLHGW